MAEVAGECTNGKSDDAVKMEVDSVAAIEKASPAAASASTSTAVKMEVEAPAKKKASLEESSDDSSDDSSSDSSDEDDSVSLSSLAKKKAPAGKIPKKTGIPKKPLPSSTSAAPKKSVVPASNSAVKKESANVPVKKEAPVAKKASVAKAPPKKKPRVESSDDSDSSSDDDSSDDDSSDDDSSDDDSSDDDSSDDEPLTAKRKRPTKSSKSAKVKREPRGEPAGSISANLQPCSKYTMREKNTPLVAQQGANKWWNRLSADKTIRWRTLSHNGPIFPPAYQPHRVALVYDKEKIVLSPAAEEVATFYASMLETDFMKKDVFNQNFFRDWRKTMTEEERKKITDLKKCDFKPINAYLLAEKEAKKEKSKQPEEKKRSKEEKEELLAIHGHALVDGYLEKVGNFRVEPPGLFRGRGEHPKTGTLKTRVVPEDVVINIGQGEEIPKAPEGHTWKGVIHNDKVTWLAYWSDNVNGDYKYVYLSASSRFKGESDINKYKKAQRLIKYIGMIRNNYNRDMTHSDREKRQLAVAMYALDVLALRVGNEKDLDERADTVGLCSLRVEHIDFPAENQVHLTFLGKDSMVYDNTVTVPPKVFKNLKEFAAKKSPKDDLFEKLNPSILNLHLKEIMPGLSAKVFRTYNASVTLEQELYKPNEDGQTITSETSEKDKVLFYNRANREVAILCNHQRSVPKAFDGQMEKLEGKLEEQKETLRQLKEHLKFLKTGKAKKASASKNKNNDNPPLKLPSSVESCKSRIKTMEAAVEAKQTQIQLKNDTKTVALGTSKINYMDPRVTVAWCKSVDLPLEKVFNKALIAKFPWAMEVKTSWRFKDV